MIAHSLLLSGRGVRLAPLYDLGMHAPYPSSAPLKSAMKIGADSGAAFAQERGWSTS